MNEEDFFSLWTEVLILLSISPVEAGKQNIKKRNEAKLIFLSME